MPTAPSARSRVNAEEAKCHVRHREEIGRGLRECGRAQVELILKAQSKRSVYGADRAPPRGVAAAF